MKQSKSDGVLLPRPMIPQEEFIPTRSSLLSRIRDWDDRQSWQEFFDTYWRLIYRTARASGLQPADAQDVVQETLIAVSKAIHKLDYDSTRGSFKGWLRTTTMWRINDRVRQLKRYDSQVLTAREQTSPKAVEGAQSVNATWESSWEENIKEVALERLKKRVSAKHYQIFELGCLREWETQEVAKRLKLSRAYVYLIKHRIRRRLIQEMNTLRKNPGNVLPKRSVGV